MGSGAVQTPWKTDRWYVSYLNYLGDVVRRFSFPRAIKIHDVTLRDGEQQARLTFRKDEKIRIAEQLAEAGVHRIEAGMPAVCREDAEAIAEIARRELGCEIFCFSRCTREDIDRAADCGVTGVVVEIPSSEHIISEAYEWPLEKAMGLSIEATAYAHEKGLYTVFFPIDATRAELRWFLKLIRAVAAQGHMDALAIVDTFGGCSPHAIEYLVRRVRAAVGTPIETHFHDDLGMAAANTVIALAAGAEVAHVTVTSIGERAGNASLEDVAVALLTMYGKDLGLKYEKLYGLSKLVREIANLPVPPNRPVVGDDIFKVESGIISSWLLKCREKCPTELFPFHWSLVGQEPPELILGKWSGKPSVLAWLSDLGAKATDAQADDILLSVKRRALELKRPLTRDEFSAIASGVLDSRMGRSAS